MVRKYRILIAEDEQPIAKALQLKLTRLGFYPSIASNGEEALDLLAKEKFDLMLLDLVMPKIDGWGVLGAIRKKR